MYNWAYCEISKCPVMPIMPKITGEVQVKIGGQLNVTCSTAGGKPSPKLIWYKGDELIDDSFEYLPDNSTINSLTMLEPIQKSDVDLTFKCKAIAYNSSVDSLFHIDPVYCSSENFTCNNGNCIFPWHRCDNEDDCEDGSDEDGCDKEICEDIKGEYCKTLIEDILLDCTNGYNTVNCKKTCNSCNNTEINHHSKAAKFYANTKSFIANSLLNEIDVREGIVSSRKYCKTLPVSPIQIPRQYRMLLNKFIPATPECKFPFQYNGKLYNKCTTASSTSRATGLWCATDNTHPIVDVENKGYLDSLLTDVLERNVKWGYCDLENKDDCFENVTREWACYAFDWFSPASLKYRLKSKDFCLSEWYRHQQANSQPECNNDIAPMITFYHNFNQTELCNIDMKNNQTSNQECLKIIASIITSKPTWVVYLIHGFGGYMGWYGNMRKSFLGAWRPNGFQNASDILIGEVNWSKASSGTFITSRKKRALSYISRHIKTRNICSPVVNVFSSGFDSSYLTSASNTMIMGSMLGDLTKRIESYNVNQWTKYMCFGHSLGSHICGFIGKTFKKLDVIIAMDPAGPIFETNSIDQRLHKTDANLVEILHTNTKLLGIKKPIGDIDIYVNGGYEQPGCPRPEDGVMTFVDYVYCNHEAYNFLTEIWNIKGRGGYCEASLKYKCEKDRWTNVGFCYLENRNETWEVGNIDHILDIKDNPEIDLTGVYIMKTAQKDTLCPLTWISDTF